MSPMKRRSSEEADVADVEAVVEAVAEAGDGAEEDGVVVVTGVEAVHGGTTGGADGGQVYFCA